MLDKNYIECGKIINTHGIRGEVLISHGGGHCLEPIECEAVSLSLAEVLAQMADFVLTL